MRRLIIAITIIGLMFVPFAPAGSVDEGSRPFNDREKIDEDLLRKLCNRQIADLVRKSRGKTAYSEVYVKAADFMIRHPEIRDQTDGDGFHVPAIRIILEKFGHKASFVDTNYSWAKTICPTIRKFNATDTYGNIASRLVTKVFRNNRGMILKSRYFGVGLRVYEDWERRGENSEPILSEPKVMKIHAQVAYGD